MREGGNWREASWKDTAIVLRLQARVYIESEKERKDLRLMPKTQPTKFFLTDFLVHLFIQELFLRVADGSDTVLKDI